MAHLSQVDDANRIYRSGEGELIEMRVRRDEPNGGRLESDDPWWRWYKGFVSYMANARPRRWQCFETGELYGLVGVTQCDDCDYTD